VTLRLRIPLRQHDHGFARAVFDFCGKNALVQCCSQAKVCGQPLVQVS
jgi:hypothetical protein